MTIVERVLAAASERPDAPAIEGDRSAVSYGELRERVVLAVEALRASGIRPGDRVALVVGDPVAWASAYFAVLCADAVAVLLPFTSPAPELWRSLEHADARAIVLDAEHADAEKVRTAALDRSMAVLRVPARTDAVEADAAATAVPAGDAAGAVPSDAAADAVPDLAVLLYTSGTTGRPKGVMLTHENLASNALAIAHALRLVPDDRGVSALPFNYSFGLSVLNSHLVVGAGIVVERTSIFPVRLLERARRSGATGLYGTPTTLAQLVGRADPRAHPLERLRYVAQAGGALLDGTRARVEAAFPGARLIPMYGQTEATARITCMDEDARPLHAASVGRAIEGTNIEIRDAEGRVVATGESGEVWVRGPGVMAGYWRDPAATAEAVVDGWLRTGDVGRLDEAGCLYIAGRSDDMIKSGGFRIYPAEIESVIEALPGIREAAVVGREDATLGQVLEAYVVADEGHADAGAVKRACRAMLASHKVPAAIHFVADLPRTANGKVRRRELAERARGAQG
jgi:acyl-CoA synthetase (AMP-forming)/AMP-acid ligase II